MKNVLIYNAQGIEEIYSEEELGLDGSEEWVEEEVDSEVIIRLEIFDGIGRYWYDDERFDEEDVLQEVEYLGEDF